MKNFLIYTIVSSMMSITGSLIYAKYYLSPKMKDLLQSKASEALGVPVQIHDLRVIVLPKFSLAATGVKFAMTEPNLKVDIPKLSIEFPINKSLLSRTSTFGPIVVRMDEARLNFETTATKPIDPSQLQDQIITTTKIKFARDISIDLSVLRARFKLVEKSTAGEIVNETTLDPLNFDLQIPGIEKEWSTQIKTHLGMTHPQLGLPIELSTEFTYKDQVLSLAAATGSVAGVAFKLSGEQNFIEKTANWKAIVDTSDFTKVKTPPAIPHLKKLSGSFHADLNASLTRDADWYFFGQMQAKALSAETDWSRDELKLTGSAIVDCDSQFSYSKALKVEKMTLHSQLDDLEIKFADYFVKPKGVGATTDLSLSENNEIIYLNDFVFKFLNLKAYAKGEIAVSGNARSDVAVAIDPMNLSGWEKYLKPFSAAPLSGQFETKFDIVKETQESDAKLDFKTFKVDKMKGVINYSGAKLQAKGNIESNFQMSGSYYLTKNLFENSVSVIGDAQLNLAELNYHRLPETEVTAAELPAVAPPLIEKNFSLYRQAKFKLNIQAQYFSFEQFKAEDFVSAFIFDKQNMLGSVKINKFFGGEAEFKNLKSDFKTPTPALSGEVDLKNVDVQNLSTTIEKDFTGTLAGQLSGQAFFETPFFDFDKVRASGRVNLKNALAGGMNFDAWINDGLSKLPGLKLLKRGTTATSSEGNLLFTYLDSNLNIQDLQVTSSSRNEAQVKGTLSLKTEDLNLVGTAHLADSPIGGDMAAANADAQGRFTVPFQVSGSVKKPQLSFAQNAVEDILKKTLSYIAKNAGDKIKRAITGGKEPVDSDDREETEDVRPDKLPEKKKAESARSHFDAIFGTH